MKAVAVAPELVAEMRRFADAAYPEECCGFLLSAESGTAEAVRRVVAVESAPNRSDGERRRRFVIRPEELRDAEQRASTRSAVVSGFFHSHPDHPARPSVFDEEHAWPWYAYLILSSGPAARPDHVGAFELDPERRAFRELPLVVPGVPPSLGEAAGR